MFRSFDKNTQKKVRYLLKHQHIFHFWMKYYDFLNETDLNTMNISFIKKTPTFYPDMKEISSKRITSSNPLPAFPAILHDTNSKKSTILLNLKKYFTRAPIV